MPFPLKTPVLPLNDQKRNKRDKKESEVCIATPPILFSFIVNQNPDPPRRSSSQARYAASLTISPLIV